MRHSQGPWYIKGYTSNGAACIRSDRTDIATAHSPRTAHGNGEATANANLIAAAPDLLAAARLFLEAYDNWNNRRECGEDDLHCATTMTREAIDKAEGNA